MVCVQHTIDVLLIDNMHNMIFSILMMELLLERPIHNMNWSNITCAINEYSYFQTRCTPFGWVVDFRDFGGTMATNWIVNSRA